MAAFPAFSVSPPGMTSTELEVETEGTRSGFESSTNQLEGLLREWAAAGAEEGR